MPVPFELITMLGSGLMSGLMTLWSQSQKAKQAAFDRAITGLAARSKATDLARKYDNKGFQITRRIIALSAVFAVIIWPKIVPVLFPDVPVVVGYTEWNPGFLFFTEGSESVTWRHMKGLVLTPLDTHLLSAIVGLYFGASMVKNAR
jgi:succinylglutamate desuccinylase